MTDGPRPRFTGIFIPAEILELDELSPLDQMLISWIDALYCKDHGGCYASNDYLAKKLRVKENTIVKAISKLRKIGLIEDVTFNGRQRVIRAKIAEYVEKSQSYADCDLNPRQGVTKIPCRVGQKSSPSIYNSKEERKDKNIAQSRTSCGREQRPDFVFSSTSGKFENISDNDLSSWRSAYPDIDISKEITRAEQWLLANPTKTRKKLWRKFLLGWFARSNEKAENKKAYRSQAGGGKLDRRTKNIDGSPVESPADGLF